MELDDGGTKVVDVDEQHPNNLNTEAPKYGKS